MTNETKAGSDTSLWNGDFTLLFFGNFFMYLSSIMIMPVLPLYLSQVGGNNFQIGLIMGCFTLSAILIRLFAVKITGWLGGMLFLMTGLITCGLAACGYYITAIISLLFLFRVLHGFGFGSSTTMFSAMVSNIIPKDRMGEGMGFFSLGIVTATAIGPFIGTTITLMHNYQWIFLLSSGLILVSMLLTVLSKACRGNEDMARGASLRISISDFFEKRALFPSSLAFFMGFAMAGFFTFMVLFGNEAGLEKGVGAFFLIMSVAEFLIRFISGKLYDRKGSFVVLVPGIIACLAGTVLLGCSRNMPLFMASSIFIGIGMGMIFPVLQGWALKFTEPNRRVAANATFFNFLDGGMATGAIILGIIAEASSYSLMYLYSSISFGLLLILYLVRHAKTRQGE
ncbi:MAG: MFS transporter [Deltaproteobacteria bacterium]|nr:MFS transporter [Deltaproteobacteria bacterium]